VFEAASRHDLVVALHFGGAPGNPPTGAGWPSFYLEEHVGMAAVFQTQLMSLVAEGVFELWPDLRLALVESGFAWLPAFLWRFDKEWKGLRREVPWLKRPPSDYVRDHVRLTLQPVDVPDTPSIPVVLDQLGSDDLLMFATDYPHWHLHESADAVLSGLDEGLRRKVLGENARHFYRVRSDR
jgi:predicted TIM-barrel fold metal-dependent hydrolase